MSESLYYLLLVKFNVNMSKRTVKTNNNNYEYFPNTSKQNTHFHILKK